VDEGGKLLPNHALNLLVELLQILRLHIVQNAADGLAHALAAGRQQETRRPTCGAAAANVAGVFENAQQFIQSLAAEAHLAEPIGQLTAQADVRLVGALKHEGLIAPFWIELEGLAEFLDDRGHSPPAARICLERIESGMGAAKGVPGLLAEFVAERLMVLQ